MNPSELLVHLESLGIHLSAEGEKLKVNAGRGQLDADLKTSIATHKVALLAALARRTSPEPIARVARGGALPLSFFQERLFVLQKLDPKNTAYTLVTKWDDAATAERAVDAIHAVVERHDILRSVFVDEEGGRPIARLVPMERVSIDLRDGRGLDLERAERDRLIAEALDAARRSTFDLGTEPPVRFVIFAGVGGSTILVVAHHIAVDAWSMELLVREITAGCRGETVSAPTLQYADYAAWQRSQQSVEATSGELAWWKKTLADTPSSSTFPHDRRRSADATGAVHDFVLDRTLGTGVRRLAREEGVTVYMIAVAACAAAQSWLTGEDDVLLGSPRGDRERTELETVLGPFVSLLVLRLDLSGDPTIAELLQRARATTLAAYEHRQVPFERLVEQLKVVRSFDHAPLVQVAIIQHHEAHGADRPIYGGGAIFDLTWFVREIEGEIHCSLEYRSDLYSPEAIRGIARRLEGVLAAAVADRQRRLSELALLSNEERQQVVERFNDTATKVEDASFAELFARQAKATPDAIAIRFEGTELRYRDLDRRANQVARLLGAAGIGPGSVVGLCLPRSIDLVISLVGVHKSGAAYLPLDPDFPRARLEYMASDCGIRAVLADGELPFSLPEGAARLDLRALPADDGDVALRRADLAYVIYTSGSTGRPKGVRVPHRALANFLAAMKAAPGIAPTDVLAAVTTLSFDIAVLELCLPLVTGARIELLAKATTSNGRALVRALADSNATMMQATPSTWRLLVEAGWQPAAGFRVLTGGEALPRELADALLERAAEVWNLYGPTETTIWSAVGRVEPGDGPILVGRPIENTRIYVLDKNRRPLPPGSSGEIFIAGAGLAEGYHARPELTAERFSIDSISGIAGERMYRTGDLGRWRSDGRLEHLGRVDHQVKVRGFRIELGEIEAVLGSHEAVSHAAVVDRAIAVGDVRLVAYVVVTQGHAPTVSELRAHLRAKLPDYMIPGQIVTLPAIPLTPAGKLDRRALPDPFAGGQRAGAAPVPPAPGTEERLAEIWREVLKVPVVGAEDNFFELGGHSLLALRVAALVEKRLATRLDPRVLFFQTLRQVASTVASKK